MSGRAPADGKLLGSVKKLPFVAGAGLALYYWNGLGMFAGVGLCWLLVIMLRPVTRRLRARNAHARWGVYLDPGFNGAIKLVALSSAPRQVYVHDTEPDGRSGKDWLLASGILVENVVGPLFNTPDGRYIGARSYQDGSFFTLVDQHAHVSYCYYDDDAPQLFAKLFESGSTPPAPALLTQIIEGADATPLFEWRGTWLPADELPESSEAVLKKTLAPQLALTAPLMGPADWRTLDDRDTFTYGEVRRVVLNGFATPFFCESLEHAMASTDRMSVMVKGCVIDEAYSPFALRWYYRGPDRLWLILDAFVYDGGGTNVGTLQAIRELNATEAVFELDLIYAAETSCYIQPAGVALPFKTKVIKDGYQFSCRVPLKKLVPAG
jgi:hypothetical protein